MNNTDIDIIIKSIEELSTVLDADKEEILNALEHAALISEEEQGMILVRMDS